MPDLVFHRDESHPPVKPVCMYCGSAATHTRTQDIVNPRLDPPGGKRFDLPRGGDDFGCIAVVFLPLLLANLAMDLRDGFRYRRAVRSAAPLVPSTTTVTITTCDRHRRFGRRFMWALLGWLGCMLFTWALVPLLGNRPGGTPPWVFAIVITSTVAAPMILLMMWGEHGPIRIGRVGRDSVTLTRVRQAYFDATP